MKPVEKLNSILKAISTSPDRSQKELTELYEIVVFSDKFILQNFPWRNFSSILTKMVISPGNKETAVLASQVINCLLNSSECALSAFRKDKILKKSMDRMSSPIEREILEGLVLIVCHYCKKFSLEEDPPIDIKLLLISISSMSIAVKREVLLSISVLVQKVLFNNYPDALPQLLYYMNNEDTSLRQNASHAFTFIINSCRPSKIPLSVLQDIPKLASSMTDLILAKTLCNLLYKATKDTHIADIIAHNPPNFESLLFSKVGVTNSEASSAILGTLQNIFPPPKLHQSLWTPHVKVSALDIKKIAPILERYLVEVGLHEMTCIGTLAACASINPIEPSHSLLAILSRQAHIPRTAPYVAALCEHFVDKTWAGRSGLVAALQTCRHLHGPQADFLRVSLKKLITISPGPQSIPSHVAFSQSFDSVLSYIRMNKILPFEFVASGLMEKCQKMLSVKAVHTEPLDILVSLGEGALQLKGLPTLRDPTKSSSFSKSVKKEFSLRIVTPNRSYVASQFAVSSKFLSVEGWYNMEHNRRSVSALAASIQNPNFIAKSLSSALDDFKKPEDFAIACRALHVPEYTKLSFVVRGIRYSAYDYIRTAVGRNFRTPDEVRMPLEVTIAEDDAKRAPFWVGDFEWVDGSQILEFIRVLAKSVDVGPCLGISKAAVAQLRSPFLSMYGFSSGIRMAFQLPSLVTFEDRLLVFKIHACDPCVGMELLRQRFEPDGDAVHRTHSRKFLLDRSRIFEQGVQIITELPFRRIEASFAGEKGIGEGPTREFFTELSREFRRCSRGIFRDDSSGEFAFADEGLFPRPDADPRAMEQLGVLVATAISSGRLLDLDFNPAFFKMAMGQSVECSEVDRVLDQSLKDIDGLMGLDFTYPGIPSLELRPDGQTDVVTPQNVFEYVSLVKMFTCGRGVATKAAAFADGFSKVIPFGALRIFRPEEICRMISGELTIFEKEAMTRAIVAEHGYDRSSKEVLMFIELACSLGAEDQRSLLQFITGCPRLPVGGLAALEPPLTIARRVAEAGSTDDQTLPSAMTCTNYFKLPGYSNEKIMREKILLAINECRGNFELT